MGSNYYERGDRINVYLADELPEDMTGTQDTKRICGKCAWYSCTNLDSICRKTGKEVAYFANRECFTTDKDMDMEENNNAQPVAESTGTQVCKECGRTLPLEDFQRLRNGNVDNVCKACRAEKARIGIARKKAVKECDTEDRKPAEWSEEDDWKRKELIQYLEEKGDYRTVWMTWLKALRSRPKSSDNLKPSEEKPVQGKVVEFNIGIISGFSDASLLDELRRRGYKGRVSKCEEVEI